MHDEDKLEMASSLWHRKAMGGWEFNAIVVPEVEVLFILLETLHEGLPVLHDICMFMAIDVHTVYLLPIPPPQLA